MVVERGVCLMPQLLVWQMAGPMASWGRVAVGEKRLSDSDPTRSAIVGLLASCLGIVRRDEDALMALSGTLGIASAILTDPASAAPAVPLRDYHTIQTAKPRGRNGTVPVSRAEELRDPGATILSERFYLTGGLYLGCAWTRTRPLVSLEGLVTALEKPAFSPYLGRRCCPVGLPFAPRIISADGCGAAMTAYLADGRTAVVLGGMPVVGHICWDMDAPGEGTRIDQRVRRRDLNVSFQRRSFAERDEMVTIVRTEDPEPQETPVPSEEDMFNALPE
jgi:CRISPR system Cascade subunit CasD